MEVVERDEVSLEESREKAEVNPVSKLTVQIIHLQVDLESFVLFSTFLLYSQSGLELSALHIKMKEIPSHKYQ